MYRDVVQWSDIRLYVVKTFLDNLAIELRESLAH